MNTYDLQSLQAENLQLRNQLQEALDTLRAIQRGEIDAVVVGDSVHSAVLTLDSADKPYRLVVDQIRQGAATLSAGGMILHGNQAFSQLLGHPDKDFAGCDFNAFLDPDYQPVLRTLMRDGLVRPAEGEVVLRHEDGSSLPLYVGVSALREGAAGVCFIFADLSEQKGRERLVAEEALARSILEQVTEAVMVCDTSGVIVRASRAAHQICGTNPITLRFEDAFHQAGLCQADGQKLELQSAWQGRRIRGLEVQLNRASGEAQDMLLSAGPLVAAGGDLLGTVLTLTDVSLLRHAETELRRRAEELQEEHRHKDEFLAMLAHELRNPLAPIRNGLNLLSLSMPADPQCMEINALMARQMDHMIRLVDDLLDVSRICSGKITLQMNEVDMRAVVSQAVEAVRPLAEERKHHVAVDLGPQPLIVRGDSTRLVQVILNLVNNAAKYTDPGGSVRVQVTHDAHTVQVAVTDNGVGISCELLPRVFDLFTQAERTLDRSQGGLGLGLNLVNRLTKMHGGTVEAFSEGPGHGSTFVLTLPLMESHHHSLARTTDHAESVDAQRRTKRILVIDDNRDAANSLAMLLRVMGHQVLTAYNSTDGLAFAEHDPPEIAIVDVGLPEIDGYEVARRLRACPSTRDAMLVAHTGYGSEEDRRACRRAGFDAHLVKPAGIDSLLGLVGK